MSRRVKAAGVMWVSGLPGESVAEHIRPPAQAKLARAGGRVRSGLLCAGVDHLAEFLFEF
jgi:hypothetical protein